MYETPNFLLQRFPLFEQRWELRDQYADILQLMDRHTSDLQSIPRDDTHYTSAQILLDEIAKFKVWSWGEADRDDFFYKKIQEFDKRARILLSLR